MVTARYGVRRARASGFPESRRGRWTGPAPLATPAVPPRPAIPAMRWCACLVGPRAWARMGTSWSMVPCCDAFRPGRPGEFGLRRGASRRRSATSPVPWSGVVGQCAGTAIGVSTDARDEESPLGPLGHAKTGIRRGRGRDGGFSPRPPGIGCVVLGGGRSSWRVGSRRLSQRPQERRPTLPSGFHPACAEQAAVIARRGILPQLRCGSRRGSCASASGPAGLRAASRPRRRRRGVRVA